MFFLDGTLSCCVCGKGKVENRICNNSLFLGEDCTIYLFSEHPGVF